LLLLGDALLYQQAKLIFQFKHLWFSVNWKLKLLRAIFLCEPHLTIGSHALRLLRCKLKARRCTFTLWLRFWILLQVNSPFQRLEIFLIIWVDWRIFVMKSLLSRLAWQNCVLLLNSLLNLSNIGIVLFCLLLAHLPGRLNIIVTGLECKRHLFLFFNLF
jgi:hypothetical protein